jgi:hypothetical protein
MSACGQLHPSVATHLQQMQLVVNTLPDKLFQQQLHTTNLWLLHLFMLTMFSWTPTSEEDSRKIHMNI